MSRSYNNQGSVQTLGGAEVLDGIQPPPLTAATNDYFSGVPGFDQASLLLLSAIAPVNLTGLKATLAKRSVILVNLSANAITLKDANAESAAANRFQLGGSDVALTQNQSITLIYLLGVGWIAGGGGGGGGGGAPTTATYLTATDETLILPNSVHLRMSGARVFLGANQALTANVNTKVAFDTTVFDTDGYVTAGGGFTVPADGFYSVAGCAVISTNAELHLAFAVNGDGTHQIAFASAVATNNTADCITTLLKLTAGDTVELDAQVSAGGINILALQELTTFSIFAVH